jgi:hypothetical protein
LLEAFLGDLETTPLPGPQRPLQSARRTALRRKTRICLGLVPRTNTAPCPFGAGVLPVASPPRLPRAHECRTLLPARHRLRPLTIRDLGLGSDSPWDDCRCPGTLRLPVWRVLHRHSRYSFRHSHLWALHPALPVRLLRCPQRSPTMNHSPVKRWLIRGFGRLLEPRYIVGAGALDQ